MLVQIPEGMDIDLSKLDAIQWLRYGYLGAAYGVSSIRI